MSDIRNQAFQATDYISLFKSFETRRVLIIGDVMLDSYMEGKVERISPEAPVPVVSVNRKENRLGGAANVALNIEALGAKAYLCAVVGKDQPGEQIRNLLNQEGISSEYLYQDASRCTTVKTRVLGNNVQIVRVDEEEVHLLEEGQQREFLSLCLSVIEKEKPDAIIFEDYDKGCLSPFLIENIVKIAKEKHIIVSVDPKKRNFWCYNGVDLFKPNFKEIREGLEAPNIEPAFESIHQAVETLRQRMDCARVMVTLSKKGLYISEKDGAELLMPAKVRRISDVSGAGDTVISVATLCLCEANLSAAQLAHVSNMAGGIVCEYLGVVPVNKEELLQELNQYAK